MEFKTGKDGKHTITCTSKELVVLSGAVNHLSSTLDDDDALAMDYAREGVMTQEEVYEISEELIVSIPSNFDMWGEPTDDFNGESEDRDRVQDVIADLKVYAFNKRLELFLNYTPRQWVEFVNACERHQRPYKVCMDEMAAPGAGGIMRVKDNE